MAQGIERVLSVDELGNLGWRLNQYQGLANMGMGRTDSEAAFQEFLKRIPSASNLAAIAGSAGQLGSALDVGALPASSASLLPTAALTADLAAAPSMPRVSSLDFLARLVTHHPPFSPAGPVQHHHATNGAVLKMEPPSGPMAMPGLISDAYPHNLHAALSAMPALQASAAAAANPLGPPPPHPVSHHPALAAAAALQLQGQLGHLSRLTAPPLPAARRATSHNTNVNTNSATSHSDGDQDNDKSENRRARRMLSNRESARRSRRRKQEHLSKLEVELNEIAEEKKAAADRAQNLERRCNSIEEENKRLREENERLRDELRFLRNEFSERKGRDSWRRDDDHDRDLPANKRGRANSGDDRIQHRNSGEHQQQQRGGGGGDEWRGRHYEDEQAEGRDEQQGQGYNGGRQRH